MPAIPTRPVFLRWAAALLLPLVAAAPAVALVTTDVIALTGDSAPDGDGSFGSSIFGNLFHSAAMNDAGQVTFYGRLTDTGDGAETNGIFHYDPGGGIIQIAREGQLVLGGEEFFYGIFPSAINEYGQGVFRTDLLSTRGSFSDQAIYVYDDVVGLSQVARGGDIAPDGNGVFRSVSFTPVFNDAGQTAFPANLTATSGGHDDDRGIFLTDSDNSLVQIAREGDAGPDGIGVLGHLFNPDLNNAGQVAYVGVIEDASGDTIEEAIFLSDGSESPTILVRQGDPVPDGKGVLSRFRAVETADISLNNLGQVAFRSEIYDVSSRYFGSGIFRSDNASGVTKITLEGDIAPDGNGEFSTLGANFALNDAGQVVFVGGLITGTSGNFYENSGIYLGDGVGDLVQIAQGGQEAPDGAGTFSNFSFRIDTTPSLNAAGQVAFVTEYKDAEGEPNGERGLYFYDEVLGLRKVMRTGDSILGSTIINLGVQGERSFSGDERSSLNNLGQVAYQFTLADGRQGIAISQVVPDIPGDYNFDGAVDAADFTLWRDSLGQTGEGLAADGDGSGAIDEGDFTIWRNNFGESAFAQAGSQLRMVPEPSTLLLGLLGCFTLRRRAAAPSR